MIVVFCSLQTCFATLSEYEFECWPLGGHLGRTPFNFEVNVTGLFGLDNSLTARAFLPEGVGFQRAATHLRLLSPELFQSFLTSRLSTPWADAMDIAVCF